MTSSIFTAFAVTLLASAPVIAQPLPDGAYGGTLVVDNRPMPVTLNLGIKGPSTTALKSLRFDRPWGCTLDVEYSGTIDAVRYYAFTSSGQSDCRVLTDGFLRLSVDGGGYKAELVKNKETKPLHTVTLKLVPASAPAAAVCAEPVPKPN